MISSAFNTTIGSFSCHSLFFLVAELWVSVTTLIKHMVGIEKMNKENRPEPKTKRKYRRPRTWKSVEWWNLSWVGACHCAKPSSHTHMASGLVWASSRLTGWEHNTVEIERERERERAPERWCFAKKTIPPTWVCLNELTWAFRSLSLFQLLNPKGLREKEKEKEKERESCLFNSVVRLRFNNAECLHGLMCPFPAKPSPSHASPPSQYYRFPWRGWVCGSVWEQMGYPTH